MDHFILKGVDIISLSKPKPTRFRTVTKNRGNSKVTSFINQNGQKVRVNYTHNVRFENIPNGQVQCWWDRHIIDGDIMCMPLKITRDKKQYVVRGEGHYCSCRCMLAYAIEENKKNFSYKDRRYKYAIGNVYRIFNIMFPDSEESLIPANDWKLLNVSGAGNQTIQDFRNSNIGKGYIKIPNIKVELISTSYFNES